MSGHLIGCAGALEDKRLTPTHKLALLAFADSADDRTHIAFPGYEGVRKWALCSRGRAAELISDLTALGYLQKHKNAHRGQRAEYVVFPAGCCELHRPAAEPQVDVEQLAQSLGVTVDQARSLLNATTGVQATINAGHPQDEGSGTSDPFSVNESGTSDPFTPAYTDDTANPVENLANGSGTSDANDGMGPERVHDSRVNANAFTPSTTTPQPPHSGGARCAKHPTAPGANCRSCGTTNRQLAAAARRAATAAAAAAKREAALAAADRRAAREAAALAARLTPGATTGRQARTAAGAKAARQALAKETR